MCSRMIRTLRPLVLIQQIHCTPWLVMNENMNYSRRPEKMQEIRALERPTLEAAMEWCVQQHSEGRYYIIESPVPSRLWEQECVVKTLEKTGAHTSDCHSGAYGGRDSQGNPIIKSFRFASNNKVLIEMLGQKLTQEQKQLCKPLEGKEVTNSQVYPEGLVTAILKGVKKVAQARNPSRFQPKRVFAAYSLPVDDQHLWGTLLDSASDMLLGTSTKNYVLQSEDQIFQMLQQLVPWQLTRVQISLQPMLKRHPTHVPCTHRGFAARYAGADRVEVITEDLADVHFPRSRFPRPVEVAIFFYGYPEETDESMGIPGEEQKILDDNNPQKFEDPTKEIFHHEISFPNTSGIDRTIKTSVARMHRNMGHLPPAEMIKLLALNGITGDHIIKCIKAMRCDACLRSKGPQRPNPATSNPQYLGQFADNLQMDIFYVRDITSTNHIILGIICEATHLHVAIRLPSRNPSDVCDGFKNAWSRSFGFPLKLSLDDDGSFKGAFSDWMDDVGVFVNIIPPESHHQIGLVERHNDTLRMLIERIVDSMACATIQEIDNAVISASYAKNSATWSLGRPPYVAALGRIPRVGLDLMNDPRALVSGSTQAESHQQAALMRAEAMRAIAESTASSTLRRALLRKTNPENILEPQPGSLLAYWRWTTRSHRKRGGYRIARYLGRDPDGRNLWLQSGNQTVRVSHDQIRNVFGYEQYVPTHEDIAALKDAEHNLRNDLWQDERLPAGVPVPDPQEGDIELDSNNFMPLTAPQIVESSDHPVQPHVELEQRQQDPQQTTINQSLRLSQHFHQTQNVFGQAQPPQPAPFTPSRRRPSGVTGQRRTPALPASRARSRTPNTTEVELRRAKSSRIEGIVDAVTSHATHDHGSETPGDAQQHVSPDLQQQAAAQPQNEVEVIEVMDDDGPSNPLQSPSTPLLDDGYMADSMVPVTPPGIASSSSPSQALITGRLQARKMDENQFELYNYVSAFGPPLQGLSCWARLDYGITSPQSTSSLGPPLSSIK